MVLYKCSVSYRLAGYIHTLCAKVEGYNKLAGIIIFLSY